MKEKKLPRHSSRPRAQVSRVHFVLLNRWIQDVAGPLLSSNEGRNLTMNFHCECINLECTDRINLTLNDYLNAHRGGEKYIVCEGHENTSLEHILERQPSYLITEQLHDAAN